MNIRTASEVGFCFGVKRAINMTRQALAEENDVFILGDLIHNRAVTGELEARGLQKLDDISEVHLHPADMRGAFELIASGEIDPMALVSHRLALEDTARALELQRSGEALKVVVLP